MGRTYKQLSLDDRCEIARLSANGSSVGQIAAALDRPPSTISRELNRNCGRQVGYKPSYAQHDATNHQGVRAGRRQREVSPPLPKAREHLRLTRALKKQQRAKPARSVGIPCGDSCHERRFVFIDAARLIGIFLFCTDGLVIGCSDCCHRNYPLAVCEPGGHT